MSQQWGIFNDEASDYSEAEALEAGFYSLAEALAAVSERYSDEDGCTVHLIEEPEEEEADEEDETDEEEEE